MVSVIKTSFIVFIIVFLHVDFIVTQSFGADYVRYCLFTNENNNVYLQNMYLNSVPTQTGHWKFNSNSQHSSKFTYINHPSFNGYTPICFYLNARYNSNNYYNIWRFNYSPTGDDSAFYGSDVFTINWLQDAYHSFNNGGFIPYFLGSSFPLLTNLSSVMAQICIGTYGSGYSAMSIEYVVTTVGDNCVSRFSIAPYFYTPFNVLITAPQITVTSFNEYLLSSQSTILSQQTFTNNNQYISQTIDLSNSIETTTSQTISVDTTRSTQFTNSNSLSVDLSASASIGFSGFGFDATGSITDSQASQYSTSTDTSYSTSSALAYTTDSTQVVMQDISFILPPNSQTTVTISNTILTTSYNINFTMFFPIQNVDSYEQLSLISVTNSQNSVSFT